MKIDKDGCIIVTLGAFSKNISPDVLEDFRKRCAAGQAHMELDRFEPQRTYSIDHSKVCAQIMDVSVSEDGKFLKGVIKPSGPHGDLLKKMLEEESCEFSVRSIHTAESHKQPSKIISWPAVSKD